MRGRSYHALVGAAGGLYHSVGDRETAIRQLALDFNQTYADIGHAIGVLPDEGSAARVAALGPQGALWFTWWQAVERPLMSEWATWKAQQLSGDTTGPGGSWIAYANRWATPWSEIEHWRTRLTDFRDGAKKLGIPLTSSAPAALPTTIVEDVTHAAHDVAHGAASAVGDVWHVSKALVYGGIAVGAGVVLTSLIANLRSGSDPIVTWRRRGR